MNVNVARANRKRMSPLEAKLWNLLRTEPFAALYFRRQVPLGRYYCDFASHAARVVIEVDGRTHYEGAAIACDQARTAFIESPGYSVLRFTSVEVLQNIARVSDAIVSRLPPPTTLRVVPPPPQGGGRAD